MTRAKLLVLAVLAVAAAQPLPPPAAADEGASFVDTFGGIDRGRWLVSHGWSNGDFQDCTFQESNIKIVPGGGVELTLQDAAGLERPSSCAELQSHATYGFGTYEVRLRAASSPGLVTAFFTYTGPGQAPGRPHDEIDFEFLGKSPDAVQLNYFARGIGGHGHDVALGYSAAQEAADYAFEWTADAIRWFVNGRMVHEVTRRSGEPFPTHPGKICLSIWNGRGPDMASWLAPFGGRGQRLVARVERVAFTRLGEPCRFPGSIVCQRQSGR